MYTHTREVGTGLAPLLASKLRRVTVCMENRFGAPASGTPEWSARREFELLLLLGGSRKAAGQLWIHVAAQAAHLRQRPADSGQASHRG